MAAADRLRSRAETLPRALSTAERKELRTGRISHWRNGRVLTTFRSADRRALATSGLEAGSLEDR